MKYDESIYKFNMDTGFVELLLRDGRMISIDCTGVENEQHPICPTGFGLTNGAFLYVEKNERRIAENESNFYSARCFAR